jgi:hypothetical protein
MAYSRQKPSYFRNSYIRNCYEGMTWQSPKGEIISETTGTWLGVLVSWRITFYSYSGAYVPHRRGLATGAPGALVVERRPLPCPNLRTAG